MQIRRRLPCRVYARGPVSYTHLDVYKRQVVILSMPTAAYVAIFSANSGNDTDLASQIVFIASLLSLATIPLMLYLVS